MPFIARRKIHKLTAGVDSGTFQVTHPDITTAQCGIVFGTGARSTDGVLHDHGYLGIGFFDNASQMSMGSAATYGVATSDTRRCQQTAVCQFVAPDSFSYQGRFRITSFIPGGVECTYEQAFLYDFEVVFLFFEGTLNYDLRSDVDLHGGSANIGFKPDILFCATDTGEFGGVQLHSKGSFGLAVRDPGNDAVTQWAQGWEQRSNQSNAEFRGGMQSGYISLRAFRGSTYPGRYALASFDAAGYTFAAAELSMVGTPLLALQLPADQQPLAGFHQLRASIGSETIPTPYASGPDASDFVLFHGTDLSTTPTDRALAINAMVWGSADSDLDQQSFDYADDDGNPTMQARSIFRSDCVFNCQNGFGTPIYYRADVTSMTGGFTLRSTIVEAGSEPYIGWLAVQSGAAAPSDDVEVALPTAASLLDAYDPATRTTEHVGSTPLIESLPLTAHPPGVLAQENARSTNPGSSSSLVARPPATVVMDATRVTAPTAASIARGRAPLIEVESDVKIGLPSLSLALRGYTPGVDAGTDANVQLPSGSLPLGAYVGTISIPENVETGLLTTNLDLKVYAPVARTTEHVGSYLVTASLVVEASLPAVVVEGEIGVGLPTASLAVSATAPQVSSGNVVNSMLPAARMGLTAYPPGTFVEFDVQTALPTAHSLGAVYGPGTYLAGDKVSTPSSARLRLMTAPPRVAVGDPATMAPKDGGALGPVLAEVVVPTMNQKVVP